MKVPTALNDHIPPNTTTYHCNCGEIYGEPCEWAGPFKDLVLVEYMPTWLRSSHEAANNSGRYPMNGAERVAVAAVCAETLVIDHQPWVEILEEHEDLCVYAAQIHT